MIPTTFTTFIYFHQKLINAYCWKNSWDCQTALLYWTMGPIDFRGNHESQEFHKSYLQQVVVVDISCLPMVHQADEPKAFSQNLLKLFSLSIPLRDRIDERTNCLLSTSFLHKKNYWPQPRRRDTALAQYPYPFSTAVKSTILKKWTDRRVLLSWVTVKVK